MNSQFEDVPANEGSYGVVVFHGNDSGFQVLNDSDLQPGTIEATVAQLGVRVETYAALTGLDVEMASTLAVILQNINLATVRSREDLAILLAPRPRLMYARPVREMLARDLPRLMSMLPGGAQYLPLLQSMFAIYVSEGDDMDRLEQLLREELSGVPEQRWGTVLIHFQAILELCGPSAQRFLAGQN
jgi:hypothetical protein